MLRVITYATDVNVWGLNERQLKYIAETGLHHFACLPSFDIDHALITALVERWRPETNTFHLNSGEATVTLQDVAYIYGLPIDGEPVTGVTFSSSTKVQQVCDELLGMVPDGKNCQGVQINFSWFQRNFAQTSDTKTSKTHDERVARAFLFCLVAGQLFNNSSGSRGQAFLLELFRKFERLAWGPACLANLYRSLARATTLVKKGKERKVIKTVTGPLHLLQVIGYPMALYSLFKQLYFLLTLL